MRFDFVAEKSNVKCVVFFFSVGGFGRNYSKLGNGVGHVTRKTPDMYTRGKNILRITLYLPVSLAAYTPYWCAGNTHGQVDKPIYKTHPKQKILVKNK